MVYFLLVSMAQGFTGRKDRGSTRTAAEAEKDKTNGN
jgi:hypothetical protein